MVRFNVPSNSKPKPKSASLLFMDLKRDPSIKFLWAHQEEMLREYTNAHSTSKDLAVELPTGSGKTLVGLLIAEYRRRTNDERIAYLCPTKQLCHQVLRQAKAYGIPTSLLVGPQAGYDQRAFLAYQAAESIAVTTYSAIFNSNPRIDDPQVVVFDDAHSGENYVSNMWTVRITSANHHDSYAALFALLKPAIPSHMVQIVESEHRHPADRMSVELVSVLAANELLNDVEDLLDEHASNQDFRYAWKNLAAHLAACAIYVSAEAFEIRPIVSPTLTHLPFKNAHQRIYMSATLGEAGGLERAFGVKRIPRLPMPEGWERRGTGRRLILFPSLGEESDSEMEVSNSIVSEAGRALMLVPDYWRRNTALRAVPSSISVLGAEDIETDLSRFIDHTLPVVLLLANRYDGIDLPGDQCRALFIAGLPAGIGLQERYLYERIGASSLLRDQIRTRITQAMGRCTRDESDRSVVVILGDDLVKWLYTKSNVGGMHSELQAEIELGKNVSKDAQASDFVELSQAFFAQSSNWDEAEAFIVQATEDRSRVLDSASGALLSSAPSEIDYAYALWDGRYDDALEHARIVLDSLEGGLELRPYRSYWHYLASIPAFLRFKETDDESFKSAMLTYLLQASRTSSGMTWLPRLRSRFVPNAEVNDTSLPMQDWFNAINRLIELWKPAGSRFHRETRETIEQIRSVDPTQFEKGLDRLGQMLGATTHRWKEDGAPDGLWVFGNWRAYVFEAKSDESAEGEISLETVRQARTHEERVRSDKLISPETPCITVVISPRERLHALARPHAAGLKCLTLASVSGMFDHVLPALTGVRARAQDVADEQLMDVAQQLYQGEGLGLRDIAAYLEQSPLFDLPN